ncbi:MAG: DEAD/DEAH box helicase family protein [Acidobacteria bacterium]|nr:DEAD/DEAH box helicase family protein [Acidobacteriota bacterium]
MFISKENIDHLTWQAFERAVSRLLLHQGFEGLRVVGQTRDGGADVIAHLASKRWLFQVKHWKARVGPDVIDRTLEAMRLYRAQVPVVVALNGFQDAVREQQRALLSGGIPLQLWDRSILVERAQRLDDAYPLPPGRFEIRDYQEDAIRSLVQIYSEGHIRKALVVMATGLGKTFVAAEAIRRINATSPIRLLLVLAHSNELIYQLERSFWPFLKASQTTVVWNGYERPAQSELSKAACVFACLDSVFEHVNRNQELPSFEIVLVDECHHAGGMMYQRVLGELRGGQANGPFLVGLTATPWRPDEVDLQAYFGEPLVCVDLVSGLKRGFLTNVDYRMYTDNINWKALTELHGRAFSPRAINRTLFITQWDDAVVYELKAAWKEQPKPRAIVFCGTIDHAITMRDRINALGFCSAAAIYSQPVAGKAMAPYERNRVLSDFHDGTIDVVCAVDIFNEGVDVPDVNIIVFQRVTHSRRIFIQQLGRGLRLAPGKEKVIVLDFVSDIRRFAAGIELKDKLEGAGETGQTGSIRVRLPHKVRFQRVGHEDPEAESFLREWLEDVAAVEAAGEDAGVLKFPPPLPGGRE